MTTQTNEQRVKDVWPDALVRRYKLDNGYYIYIAYSDPKETKYLGEANFRQSAWQNAADNLTDKRKGE